MDYLIDEYIRSKMVNQRKYKRFKSKVHLLKRFEEFLGDRDLKEIGVKEAQEYQGWIIQYGEDYSPSTVIEYISAVSKFFNYLKNRGILFENPFKSIKKVKLNKKIPRNILNEKDMDSLLSVLRDWNKGRFLNHRVTLYRMHVIAELMYSTGLRVHEVARLKVGDIDLRNRVVHVREGKGGFSRAAILNDYATDVLDMYINRIREFTFNRRNSDNRDLLFCLKESTCEKFVNNNLKRVTESNRLRSITSHGFRHALGYHLLRSGCSIRHIKEILGHKSLKNTEIYTKVDKDDLKRVLNQYHPRS